MKECAFPKEPVNVRVAYAGEQILQGCLCWHSEEGYRANPRQGGLTRRYVNGSPWVAVFVRRPKQR